MNNSATIALGGSGHDGDVAEDDPFADCVYQGASQLETGIRSSVMLAVLLLSLVGNSLVIQVIRSNNRLRKVSHYLIANLAVADLLITIIRMPDSVRLEITGSFEWFSGPFGLVLCKVLPFCQLVSVSCSIFTMVVISFNKFVNIVYPLRGILTLDRFCVVVALVWLASVMAALPQLFANNVVHDPDGTIWCIEEWPQPFDPLQAPKHYTIVYLVALYLFPLAIIMAMYGRMLFTIWKRNVPGNSTEAATRSHRAARRKAGKMIAVVVVCFALCWLPYHVTFFLYYFDARYALCGPPDSVWFLSSFFAFANSALNPCIYFLMNSKYRTELKKMCCRRRRRVVPSTSRKVGETPLRTETATRAASPEQPKLASPATDQR